MPIGLGVGRNSATSAAIRNRKSSAPALFDVTLQCKLPEKSDRTYEQVLSEKKGRIAGGGNKWQERLCILTATKLVLSKPGSDETLDVIPLREVIDVSHVASTSTEGDVYRQEQDAMDHMHAFFLDTDEAGLCGGRNYCFRCETDASCQEWISRLKTAAHIERQLAELELEGSGITYWRTRCRKLYKSSGAQSLFCFIIVAAFLVSVISTEVQPEEGSQVHRTFAALQTSFTLAFTVELLFNMFGSFSPRFFNNKWNVFDAVVVVVSILAETLEGFPAFAMIRLIRVFRVVRLFRWMTSLRQILFALMSAILPVINSFLILLLVTCIYAVLATELFKHESEEYFGSFSLSLFTMFQIATGDAWASIVGRSLRTDDGSLHVWAVLFLVSYVLIVGLVLINIVIAVLLDEFLSTVSHEKENWRQEEQSRMRKQMGMVESPLEALLDSISSFFSNEDLSARIQYIFKLLDTDGNESLSCEELNHGLRKLDFHPPIHLSADDFEALTDGKRLCNEEGELDPTTFEVMMRTQLQQHVQMKAATALVSADSVSKSLLFVLKQMALTLELIAPVASHADNNSTAPNDDDDGPGGEDDGEQPSAVSGAEAGESLHFPRSLYVGDGLRTSVKLPSGLGYGRYHVNMGARKGVRRRKGVGAGDMGVGRTLSAPPTPSAARQQTPPRLSKGGLALSGSGKSLSLNLERCSKMLVHRETDETETEGDAEPGGVISRPVVQTEIGQGLDASSEEESNPEGRRRGGRGRGGLAGSPVPPRRGAGVLKASASMGPASASRPRQASSPSPAGSPQPRLVSSKPAAEPALPSAASAPEFSPDATRPDAPPTGDEPVPMQARIVVDVQGASKQTAVGAAGLEAAAAGGERGGAHVGEQLQAVAETKDSRTAGDGLRLSDSALMDPSPCQGHPQIPAVFATTPSGRATSDLGGNPLVADGDSPGGRRQTVLLRPTLTQTRTSDGGRGQSPGEGSTVDEAAPAADLVLRTESGSVFFAGVGKDSNQGGRGGRGVGGQGVSAGRGGVT